MTIAQSGAFNSATKDTPGEGHVADIAKNHKTLAKMRGTCFPVPDRYVSYLLRLTLIFGYGTIVSFGLIGAILAPVRDLGQSLGTLFPWRPSIPPVNGPFRPIRTFCIALGLGQVLGNPSLGWVGVVCVVECALRTWWHGGGLCPPYPLQSQRTCFSAVTRRRCRSLEVFNPSKAIRVRSLFVCVLWCCFARARCVGRGSGGLYFPSPYPAMHSV